MIKNRCNVKIKEGSKQYCVYEKGTYKNNGIDFLIT